MYVYRYMYMYMYRYMYRYVVWLVGNVLLLGEGLSRVSHFLRRKRFLRRFDSILFELPLPGSFALFRLRLQPLIIITSIPNRIQK